MNGITLEFLKLVFEIMTDSKYRLMCNMCGSYATRDDNGIILATDYCHSCGAKMRGADNG